MASHRRLHPIQWTIDHTDFLVDQRLRRNDEFYLESVETEWIFGYPLLEGLYT